MNLNPFALARRLHDRVVDSIRRALIRRLVDTAILLILIEAHRVAKADDDKGPPA
jgi:hypothetical protein